MLARLLGAVLLVLGTPAISRPASAGGPETPQAVLDSFAANFATYDVGAMVALFRPDATFFGSTVPGLLRGQDGARSYFEPSWANAPRSTMTCDPAAFQQASPDLTLFATICRLARPERTFTLRVSGAARYDEEGWRFAQLHVSAAPAPRPQPDR